MLTEAQTAYTWIDCPAGSRDREIPHTSLTVAREVEWRQIASSSTIEDITISRWEASRDAKRHEATTPDGRYFVGIALKTTRAKLTRERQIIFDGTMPSGTLYVSAPSRRLSAQFEGPCDFLHFHISADHFPARWSPDAAEELDDLVLLRDPLAAGLTRALAEQGDAAGHQFARCIGEILAMHLARPELPRAKVNALPKWRLRRVEHHIAAHFERGISLSELANVAGLSRMHFAAQFRAATGYRPREYLLNHRIEQAKSMLTTTERPLAEIALAVGFSTQAHFSTVFKRISGETPARWRAASKGHRPDVEVLSRRRPSWDRDHIVSTAA
ncbi:helix-turn-helix domain-containing protein [Bradyrhizobium sp. CCBAU 53338]|uniref:helix-turn-helix domain-containing protein n=1 Tax=Bradyrhizobium sp. CCBAU 53338 TaxID=1325111 RepID=UPI00188AA402|nr:AraC family transcriptional regulator [Bradyrhizobium sp. CCBAU 53338]QOZ53955.1 AraC family transcriptional regulator [Bradyrhizobium sp. CCBAU 53338]